LIAKPKLGSANSRLKQLASLAPQVSNQPAGIGEQARSTPVLQTALKRAPGVGNAVLRRFVP
jgi:hypothetical protein